jgi:acyl-CoA thioesterase FadM
MHLIFRTIHIFLRARRGERISRFGIAETPFRVWATDLDIFRHMNNGVYLSILDLGRMDLLSRSGIWAVFTAKRWYPVVVAETISFRKSLTLGQRFTVESKVLGFDAKSVYIQQRFVVAGEVYAEAFVRGRFLKRGGGVVQIPEVLAALGALPEDLIVPKWVLAWAEVTALPTTREPAPSDW